MLLTRLVRPAVPLVLLALLVGCQGNGASAPMASAAPQKAVLITTGQGTTAVIIPSSDGTGVARLASDGTPACKQCEEDAKAYFMSGTISPKCSVCGATRIPLHSVN